MMNRLFLVVLGFWLLISPSCQKKEPIIIPDVADEFRITVSEKLSEVQEAQPVIRISTIQEMDANYEIDATLVHRNGDLEVEIHNIIMEGNPSGQDKIIQKEIDLGVMETGSYSISVNIRNTLVNEGELYVGPKFIELNFGTDYGITPSNQKLHIIPEHCIWGVAQVNIPENLHVVDSFLADIAQVSVDYGFAAGNYGYYDLDDNGMLTYNTEFQGSSHHEPNETTKTFIMMTAENQEAVIDSIVQEYKQQHINVLDVRLRGENGAIFSRVSNPSEATAIETTNDRY